MKKLIFLSAIEDESSYLKSYINALKINTEKILFLAFGVGLFNGIIYLHKRISTLSNGRVILIGTAGIMGEDFIPGKIYQASSFKLGSVTLAEGKGYIPQGVYPDIKAKVIQHLPEDIETLPVINTPEITLSEEGAGFLIKRYGICLENLESYSIANLFKRNNINLSAFFAVTNKVGILSHKQYLENREFAWKTLGDTISKILLSHWNEF
ncbi:MAG: hypothetical protein SV062_10700 [Thermodesulfobacteriota bacterium]|nr:hypothetical protein [Thermodesulfobacteriota bacterium]